MDLLLDLEKNIPKELVKKLFEHYAIIKNNYRAGRHEISELNGSKFSEVVFRILQNNFYGKYTPLDKQINRFTDECRKFEGLPAMGIDDTLRIHVPRTLILIVDIRNKRGVGHVSGIHSPNDLDSILTKTCADWIMAEIVRVFAGISIDEAQSVIENIVRIDLPIIEKIDDIRRVLNTSLRYDEQVLILLYGEYPSFIRINDLFVWTEHSHITKFTQILNKLHGDRYIEMRENECKLLQPGIIRAEKIIKNKKL